MQSQYTLPPIADFLPLSGQLLMDHVLKNGLTRSPGLLLHSVLCQIIAYALAKKLPSELVDIDTLLSLGLVAHSTRIIADEGIQGKSLNDEINDFMRTHSNMDFAHKDAIEEGFSSGITEGLQHFIGNPRTRTGYFPHETILKDGKINWTEALYQIASWSIAGGITTLDNRFDDLRARRSVDIGRLERAYILEQSSNKEYRIPQPILDELSHELGKTVDTSETISLFLSDTDVYNDKKIGILILNSYQSWAQEVRRQYCELAGIDDFDTFLRNQVDTVSNLELRDPIQKSFEYAIGRSLREDEFFPTILGIELLYRRIGDMKVEGIKDRAKKKFEKLMGKIERATLLFHK